MPLAFGGSGDKVLKYLRALQDNAILDFRLKPSRSKVRMKTLRENLERFTDYDIDMPEDAGTLDAGLRELAHDGLLQISEGGPRYVSVTDKGANLLSSI